MSLSEIEVLSEVVTQNNREAGEGKILYKMKVAFVERTCAVSSSVSKRFLYATYNYTSIKWAAVSENGPWGENFQSWFLAQNSSLGSCR